MCDKPFNRVYFLSEQEACLWGQNHLCEYQWYVKKDSGGYWISVDWDNGMIAYLSYGEFNQLEGNTPI